MQILLFVGEAQVRIRDLDGERLLQSDQVGEALRRSIEKRFGAIPDWAASRLANSSITELEELSLRLLDAGSLEELLT